jgi:hypothetical protein
MIKMETKQIENGKIMTWVILTLVLVCVVGFRAVYAADASDITPTNQPVLQVDLLNQDPDPARTGDTADIRFKVENTGSAAVTNLIVELLEDYPFTVVNGDAVKDLGTINAGLTGNDYRTFEYVVKIDKDNIQPERTLRVRYKYDNVQWITESFVVNIASKEFAQIIYVDKAQLDPGKETNMTFTITNVGNAPLQNLVFSWDEATGEILPVYSSDTKYVKYLDVGQSVDLTYIVIANVNADPGLYQLDLSLKSESLVNATPLVLTTKAGVFVGGETDFDVAFSESTAGQTSLSVSNIGNNPAQSVSVTIPAQQNFRVSGTNSAIIGNLDKGDYTLVSFQIVSASSGNFTGTDQGAGARQLPSQNLTNTGRRFGSNESFGGFGNASSNPNNLRVIVSYTDTTGQRRNVEKSVSIQFRSASSSGTATGTGTSFGNRTQSSGFVGSTAFWIILIVVVVGVGIFVYRKKATAKKEKMILAERKR